MSDLVAHQSSLTVTTATNHSKYCAGAKAGRKAKWLEKIFLFLGQGSSVQPIDLFSDSKGAIAMAYNPVQRSASKHIDLADHYLRELQELGTVTISWICTEDMTADVLTKALPPKTRNYANSDHRMNFQTIISTVITLNSA